MNQRRKQLSIRLLAMAGLLAIAPMQATWAKPAHTPNPKAPSLGVASDFAALGGAGVACTSPLLSLPAITVDGDVGSKLVGVSSVTGFPGFTPGVQPCSLSGSVILGTDAVAVQAWNDLFADGYAYDTLAGMTCPAANILPATLPAELTLEPGVYCFVGAANLSGSIVTLKGGKDAIWVFQVGSDMTTGNTAVIMDKGGKACNVFWQVGTQASIGTQTAFSGNILAGSSTVFTGPDASLLGRAFAKVGSVTMTGAAIGDCGNTTKTPKPPKHSKH